MSMNETKHTGDVPMSVTMRHADIASVRAKSDSPYPLVVRRAHRREASALASLLGGAFIGEHWDPLGTESELFDDETVKATLVIGTKSRLVATASLQVLPADPACGWLRWVATAADWRRAGLARTLVLGVLALAAQNGCRHARLRTENDRLAAISLYMQLGFKPVVSSDSERKVWDHIIRALP